MDIDYDSDLIDKLAKNDELWKLIEPHATNGAVFNLDFFFYADAKGAADQTAAQLKQLGYDVKSTKEGTLFNRLWAITGSTPPMSLSREGIDEWTRSMIEVARAASTQFDGWGTALPQ